MVYLNEEFEGGETVFFVEPEKSIKPRAGMGLLFQHPIIHEGAEVTKRDQIRDTNRFDVS